MRRLGGVLVCLAAITTSCCGPAIMREEMAAMAERECPNLLALVEVSDAELSASEQRLVEWCLAQQGAGYE